MPGKVAKPMKRALASTLAALSLVAVLGGCQQQKSAEQPATAPEAKPGLSASDGVLFLPVTKGNPGAAYFTLTNAGDKAATLAAVSIDGAGTAEMHESKGSTMSPLSTVAVPAGGTVLFERGGKHVMAFELADTVKPGGTAELTLTFAGGDKLSVPLRVEAMGGAAMHIKASGGATGDTKDGATDEAKGEATMHSEAMDHGESHGDMH